MAPAQANDPVAGVQYPHHGFIRKVHLRAQVRTPGCALARACVSTGVLCWEVGQRLPRTALRTTLACTQAYRDTAREAQSAQNGHHWDANRAHAQHQAVPQVDSNTVQAPVHAHCAQQHVAAGTRNEDLRPCPGSQSERARGKDGSCAPGSCEHATYAHAQAGQGQTDRAHCEAQEEARHPEDEAETEDQSTELGGGGDDDDGGGGARHRRRKILSDMGHPLTATAVRRRRGDEASSASNSGGDEAFSV